MTRVGVLLVLASHALALASQVPSAGKNEVTIRGQRQDIYFYPARGGPHKGTVLFAPGDGGWRGLAVTIAETVSGWGYDVYGLDTKRYLESFTGRAVVTEAEVMSDMRQIGQWARGDSGDKVVFAGWSEGADLGALAAASPENKALFGGFIAIGLSEEGILGWRWQDNITYVTKKNPNEPVFSTTPYLPKIAPLPFAMIHSSKDEYTSLPDAKKLFALALEPKMLSIVEAQNHRFEGNQQDFFRALREALEWMPRTTR